MIKTANRTRQGDYRDAGFSTGNQRKWRSYLDGKYGMPFVEMGESGYHYSYSGSNVRARTLHIFTIACNGELLNKQQ